MGKLMKLGKTLRVKSGAKLRLAKDGCRAVLATAGPMLELSGIDALST